MSVIERWAMWLAERYTGVYVRRDDEPVDVCRWHRDLAADIVERIAADEREAVEALAQTEAAYEQIAADLARETTERERLEAEVARLINQRGQ